VSSLYIGGALCILDDAFGFDTNPQKIHACTTGTNSGLFGQLETDLSQVCQCYWTTTYALLPGKQHTGYVWLVLLMEDVYYIYDYI